MTTTFPHSALLQDSQPTALAQFCSVLIEPFLVIATCLFWIIVLPLSGLFCLAITLFDRAVAFRASRMQLPDLRATRNPLVLRRTTTTGENVSTQRRTDAHAARA